MTTDTYFARIDSNTAGNASINLTGAPALEITFVEDTTAANGGDLAIEQGPGGTTDPDTLVEINGVTYNFTLEFTGTSPTANNAGGNQLPADLRGELVALIVVEDYPSTGNVTRLVFFPDGVTGTDGNLREVTEAEMNAIGNGRIDPIGEDFTPPPVYACFARGVELATKHGPRAVEDLQHSDILVGPNGEEHEIALILSTSYKWPGGAESAKPIEIKAGSFGHCLPSADLVVSPHHHIVLPRAIAERLGLEDRVLLPAKGLTSLPGIRVKRGAKRADYFHIVLRRHQIVLAHGIETESFFPGATIVADMDRATRAELFVRFPKLRVNPEGGYGPTALSRLSVGETRDLVEGSKRARARSAA